MSEYPLVVAGGPVAGREWIVAEWLSAMLHQDYPPDRLLIACHVADSKDETADIIRWFSERYPGRVELQEVNWATGGRNQFREGRDFDFMSGIRNAWLEMAQAHNPDYYWSLDSDIIVAPDTLSRLLAHKVPVVSSLIEFIDWRTNAMAWRDPADLEQGLSWIPEAMEKSELRRVGFTCAAMLIARSVIDAGIKWSSHPYGEDVAFGWDLFRRGIPVYVDCGTWSCHRYKDPVINLGNYPDSCRDLADFYQWRGNHVPS